MNSQIGVSVRALPPSYICEKGFARAQVCQDVMKSSSLTDVIKVSRENNIKLGYHLPIYHQSNPKDTYYLSKNFRLRDANFEILEANLRMVRGLDLDYVVIHFMSDKVRNERYESLEEFLDIAKTSLKRMNILAKEYDVKIHLEYSSVLLEYSSPKEWLNMLSGFDKLGLCLDIGELYFRSLEKNRDFYNELEELLGFAEVVNLYNARSREDIGTIGFVPPNPNQNPIDGWIDIEKVVSFIKKESREIPIILEPNFSYKGEEYFTEGVEWLSDLLNRDY